jgi:hypothetical protein
MWVIIEEFPVKMSKNFLFHFLAWTSCFTSSGGELHWKDVGEAGTYIFQLVVYFFLGLV